MRAAAKVSKGQLYHYFADKEDLVHAVIDRTVEQVLGRPARDSPNLASWAAIAGWFDDLVQLQVDRHATGGLPDRQPRRRTRRNRRTSPHGARRRL